jgi:hypothetical protein
MNATATKSDSAALLEALINHPHLRDKYASITQDTADEEDTRFAQLYEEAENASASHCPTRELAGAK